MTLRNPYVAGPSVGQTPAFVGRDAILERVLQNIYRGDLTLIHGQRRIGKTSILIELEGRLQPPYLGVYFDVNMAESTAKDDLVRALVRRICSRCDETPPDLGEGAAEAFRRGWLPGFLAARPETILVLLIDEFDVAMEAREFVEYLEGFHIERGHTLANVFAIGRSVGDLSAPAKQFFKSAVTVRVSLMERDEHDAILRLGSLDQPPALEWSDAALDAAWALTHGHAYLTQQLGSTLWERAHGGRGGRTRIDADDVAAARSEALSRSEASLEWLWAGLTPECKVIAAALAEAAYGRLSDDGLMKRLEESGVRPNAEVRSAPSRLKEWDILEAVDGAPGVYGFRVELIRIWIREHRSLAMVWDDLDRAVPAADRPYRVALKSADPAERERLCREALSINPNHTGARELLARLLGEAGRFEEALAVVDEPVDLRPAMQVQKQRSALLLEWLRTAEEPPPASERRTGSRWRERRERRKLRARREQIYHSVAKHKPEGAVKGALLVSFGAHADELYTDGDLARARVLYELADQPLHAARTAAEWRVRRLVRALMIVVLTTAIAGVIAVLSVVSLLARVTSNRQRAACEAHRVDREDLAVALLEGLADSLLAVVRLDLGLPTEGPPLHQAREELIAAMQRPPLKVTAEDREVLTIDQYLVSGAPAPGEGDGHWYAVKLNVFGRAENAGPGFAFESTIPTDDGGAPPTSRCLAIDDAGHWPVSCKIQPAKGREAGHVEVTRCEPSIWRHPDGLREAARIVCLSTYRVGRPKPLVEWGLIDADWCHPTRSRVFVGMRPPRTSAPLVVASIASDAMPERLRRVFLVESEAIPLATDAGAGRDFAGLFERFLEEPSGSDALDREVRAADRSVRGGPLTFYSSAVLADERGLCRALSAPGVEYHVLAALDGVSAESSQAPRRSAEW